MTFMTRRERAHLLDAELCYDGHGNTGRARQCFNRSTREYFLSVFVVDGPKKGEWDKAYRYRARISYQEGTIPETCAACGREFLKRLDFTGEVLCRTCSGDADRDDREGCIGSDDWKKRHLPARDESVMTDDAIAAAMQTYGGSFVSLMGKLYRLADPDNQRRLKEAFPEYFAKYEEIARFRVRT